MEETMLNKRQRQALKQHAKRRARRPEPKFLPEATMAISGRAENRLIDSHPTVLYAIESTFLHVYDACPETDDRIVALALKKAVAGQGEDDRRVDVALALLRSARLDLPGVTDDIWLDALRVVYASVKRHSTCQPGDTGYLDFIERFVP